MIDFSSYYTADEIIGLTSELVRIPSHCDVPGREARVGDYIYDWAVKNGFEVKKVHVEGERNNVYISLPGTGDGPKLLFNGHIDTVPPYDMIVEPFNPVVKDGRLYGRGSNDMKGGVACMMLALLVLKRAGIRLKGDILFTAVCGEEEESDGTEIFVLEGNRYDGAIVGEPSGYGFSLGNRGLEWIEIKFKGKTMHGGQAQLGVNAISKASKFIERVAEKLEPVLKTRTNEYMGPAIMNYGRIFGGDQVSTVAGECTLQLDRRYVPGETTETVLKEYQDIIDELHAEDPDFNAVISLMPNGQMKTLAHAPAVADPEAKINKCITKVLSQFLKTDDVPINRSRGWTDAGVLSTYLHIPTGIFGPGLLANSHTKDENVPVDMLYNFVSFYANIACDFCEREDG
ncbi:MAG: M20 family metallopeptidase [Ruminococcaceae bacterium]|nr:M20 family metallopeptidase [Oscillospiraceae bacterium]